MGKIIARTKNADEPIEIAAMTFRTGVSVSSWNIFKETEAPHSVATIALTETMSSGTGLIAPQWSNEPSDPNWWATARAITPIIRPAHGIVRSASSFDRFTETSSVA